IQADQVAVISRDPEGRYHVHTSHSGFATAGGAIWGGFWGLLFGTLFLYGGTVIKTSLSDEDRKMLQEALHLLGGREVGFAAAGWRHGGRVDRARFGRYLRCGSGVEVT